MYQQVTIVGNLGADPQLRYTPDGTPVCSFSVCTNKRWTNKDGQTSERSVWFRVSAWRKLGEVCGKYLSKGRQVMVIGELQEPRTWKSDRDGQHKASLEMTAQSVKFLGSRSDGDSGGGGGDSRAAAPQSQQVQAIDYDSYDAGDDSIPF